MAGLERGVRPIGDWLISITLSKCTIPFIDSKCSGFRKLEYNSLEIKGYKVWFIRLDLPEPDTPVMLVNFPNGNFTVTFFKLFPVAPIKVNNFPLPFRRLFCTLILACPVKYFPVSESLFSIISLGVPLATILPPWEPARGPKSKTQSAARIVFSSCSTTMTVFPKSRKCLSVLISL